MGTEPEPEHTSEDVRTWIEAGLYDPGSDTAEDRLALLRWLTDQEVPLEEMVRADADGRLFAVVGDRIVRGTGRRLTPAECADAAGLSVSRFVSVWRALGFPDPEPDAALMTASEAETFTIVALAGGILGDRASDRLATTISHAVRTIADATNVAFIEAENDTMLDRSGNELATAQVDAMFDSMIPDLHRWLSVLHVLHHEASNRHLELSYGLGDHRDVVRLAVGFADISGYTSLSNRLEHPQLVQVLSDFWQWATDQIRRAGAQLVKTLGDGVMFVGRVDAVTQAALALVSPGAAPADLGLHAGVTHGDVLPAGGDYFGPIVNLAARLCDQADDGEVLADQATADIWRTQGAAVASGTRHVKGVDGPVAVWTLLTPGHFPP